MFFAADADGHRIAAQRERILVGFIVAHVKHPIAA
jgi:hypothetical protein